ncbi:MAG: tetratricopeptide repeat protein [Bacteroidetes bacterium]|nr:tetratricopeptide repeat protein [Bacteroidota bacterium]MCL5266576.1 tetratricopeptide repeat protein [Bacteroidota bacterium]
MTIEIDVPRITAEEATFRKAVALSDNRKFEEAKKLLNGLLASNPMNSEYHRIYGQILSIKGNQDEAVNQLIDALRWDPKNTWALVMMGNIFGRYRNDIDIAVKYYEQALKGNPGNIIASNNIGATLMEQRRFGDVRKFFEAITPEHKAHPNTCFVLSLTGKIQADGKAASVVANCLDALSEKIRKPIALVPDNNIPTPAKLEFAENYAVKVHFIPHEQGHVVPYLFVNS